MTPTALQKPDVVALLRDALEDAESELVRCESERAVLIDRRDSLRRALQALDPRTRTARPRVRVITGRNSSPPIREKVLAWFGEHEEGRTREVLAAVGASAPGVTNALTDLVREGKLTKVRMGHYRRPA